MNPKSLGAVALLIWSFWAVAVIGVNIGVIYVAYHFISKLW